MTTHGEDGFTLVEALLACALLVIVLVPALSAFRSQIAATTRRGQDLSTAIALDDLAGRIDHAISETNRPSASSERLKASLLAFSDPEELTKGTGTPALLRYELSFLPSPDGPGVPRRLVLYAIAPVSTNEVAR